MKSLVLTFLGLALLLVSVLLTSSSRADKKKDSVLRHVVLFKFKPDASQQQIDEVVTAFGKLPEKIDLIQDYEWGTDVSPEKLSKGLTHCFLVTFASEKDRDGYLTHPAHLEFVKILKPILDDVTVVDYWVQ